MQFSKLKQGVSFNFIEVYANAAVSVVYKMGCFLVSIFKTGFCSCSNRCEPLTELYGMYFFELCKHIFFEKLFNLCNYQIKVIIYLNIYDTSTGCIVFLKKINIKVEVKELLIARFFH